MAETDRPAPHAPAGLTLGQLVGRLRHLGLKDTSVLEWVDLSVTDPDDVFVRLLPHGAYEVTDVGPARG